MAGNRPFFHEVADYLRRGTAEATEFIDRAEGCRTLPELVALARAYVHLDLRG
jgi:hypothetical protein